MHTDGHGHILRHAGRGEVRRAAEFDTDDRRHGRPHDGGRRLHAGRHGVGRWSDREDDVSREALSRKSIRT